MFGRRMFDWPEAGRRDPLAEFEQMRRDMARLNDAFFGERRGGGLFSGVFPAVNITEDSDHFYVSAELPGIQSSDIDIQVSGRNLSISGERKIDAGEGDVKYHRREREAGKFSRIIGLPGDIDVDRVEARMVNGMLTVTIAKSEAAKPKQITVK